MPFNQSKNAQGEIDAMMAVYTNIPAHEKYKKWALSTGMDEAFDQLQYEHKGDFGAHAEITEAESKELMDRVHKIYKVRAYKKCMDGLELPALQVIGSFNGTGQKFFNLGGWKFPPTHEEMKEELKEFFGEYEDLWKVSCEYREYDDTNRSPDYYTECNGKFFWDENMTWE